MKEKNYNLELVRAISCVMVVMIHVANYYCRAFETLFVSEYAFSVFLNTLARVSVPCFFMISGYLLLERRHSVKSSLNKALRFFIILLVWSVIYFLLKTYYTHQACDITTVLFSPTKNHLWYLYVLIPIYVILPFLQAMISGMDEKAEHAFALIGAVWIVLQNIALATGNSFYFDLPIFGDRSYLYYFYMGYYIKKYSERVKLKSSCLFTVYLAISVLLTVGTVFISLEKGEHYDKLLTYSNFLVVISSVSFFIAMTKIDKKIFNPENKLCRFMTSFAACSFGIYLCHLAVFDTYRFKTTPDAFTAFLALPVLTLGVALISFALVYLWKSATKKIKLLQRNK